ncbi:hypothetical protein DFH11DRAFT_1837886 [Phellopilus nigrolimitatus]|nr:hypothetical protein DFH11DRAFT_1837886 [Phellopilus nigrolimitatus]
MSHKAHEAYSGKNPVPKVALRSILDPSGATEAKAKGLVHNDNKDEEKEQDETARLRNRWDPVTGEETAVKYGGDEQDSTDTCNRGENILSMDYPPPNWSAHRSHVLKLTHSSIVKIMMAYVASPIFFYFISTLPFFRMLTTSQTHPYLGLAVFLIFTVTPPSILAYILLFTLDNQSAEDFADRVWDAERTRGLAAGGDYNGDGMAGDEGRVRESAEWLNTVLKGIWPIINPDLFNSVVDMLEDIMQASAPKFIHSVRVADIGQGSNAMRVTSIRSLPDIGVEEALHDADDAVKENLMREHVNVEVSFAYRALPSGSKAYTKAHNAHILVEFFLGVAGVYEFKLPVWVELKGVFGTARARMELIPDPPFIKTTLLTLMGLPRVSISVVPMSRSLPNVMNIPLLSSFIAKSIETACAEYVAPRSLTLDLQQLISGDDIKKDTEAIGVIVIHIHRATGLKKMDTRNSSDTASSDPYVTITHSRQGKPLYSTRIIFADVNPCFEETAAVIIDANAIKIRDTKLSMQLWDSDRASADDMMGFVEIDVLDLMRNKNTPTRRVSPLTSPDSESRPGSIEYTVGYYAKMVPNSKLVTDGTDPAVPEDLKKHDPDFQEARAVALNDLEAAVLITPPDPDWPSGIISIQVHEIRDVKVRMEGRETSMMGQGRKEGQKGQDDDGGEQEEGSDLPSPYCTIAINDNLIYSTRVKPITSTPVFNAGAERFLRDWRSAHISVTVRDSRMRENDPVLGIVFLKVSELLANASEVTRFFPLEDGIGYGSARISVLFRPVQAALPTNLLGFDTGTLVVHKLSVKLDSNNTDRLLSTLQSCGVKLKISSSSDKYSRKTAEHAEDGSVVWHGDRTSEIPVRQRYNTALTMRFKETVGMNPGTLGMAVLWLRDVVDGEDSTMEVALFQSNDYSRLKQNYVPPDGSLDMWDTGREKLTRIGTVRIELTFQPGISSVHRKVMNMSDRGQKNMWDEADRRGASGLQEKVGVQDGNAVSGEEKGLMDKLREWKKHEKELHRQHRGALQTKPGRTVEWLKDNVEEAGQKVKDRFKMHSRQPDIETEV